MSMLTVENLNVYYGMIHALKGLSFHVEEGEIVALIGANGAGKTTTLQTISGILQAKSGSVNFQGKEITSVPGNQIVKLGMSHVPEGRRMFSNLTVYENLMMGAYTRKDKKQIAETLEKVYERFPPAAGTYPPAGRDSVRRGTADAGHGPRSYGTAPHYPHG